MRKNIFFYVIFMLVVSSIYVPPVLAKAKEQAMNEAVEIQLGSSIADSTERCTGSMGVWMYEKYYRITIPSRQKVKIVVTGSFRQYDISFWDQNYKYIDEIDIEGADNFGHIATGTPCYAVLNKGTYYLNVACGDYNKPEEFNMSINTNLVKCSIKRIKSLKKSKVKTTIFPVFGAQSYQYQYATNRGFNKNLKCIASNSLNNSVKLKKKTYYVRVRAVVDNNGRIVYGGWSKVKRIKVK